MARRKKGDLGCGGLLLLIIGCSIINACGGGSSSSSSSSSRPRATTTQRLATNQAATRKAEAETATPRPSRTPRPSPTPEAAIYTVQPGDTLGAIAAQYDVSVEALAEANGIEDPNRIASGDELIIPGGNSVLPVRESAQTTGTSATSSLAMPDNLEAALVDRVIDGDTVDLWLTDGSLIRVRLIGIDTPETVDPNSPQECFGRESSARAQMMLAGRDVLLEADESQGDQDRFDRYLRYLWLSDGTMFNYEMVATGYAIEYTYDLPYRYQEEFRAAQSNAAENFLGLWSDSTCAGNADLPINEGNAPLPEPIAPTNSPVPPPPTPIPVPPTAPPPPASSNCDPSYPTVCIPPSPPDLDCGDIPFRRFQVIGLDPHRFDGDHDGVGCES